MDDTDDSVDGAGASSDITSISVVTCHFGDPDWIRHMVAQVDRHSDARLREIIVIDQSGDLGHARLTASRPLRILRFEPEPRFFATMGHDHPHALNQAIHDLTFITSHIAIMDSDCWPVDASWIDRLAPIHLAADPTKRSLSHPCFNLIPTALVTGLDYGQGVLELGFDTGRLIALQLSSRGITPHLDIADRSTFGGRRGHRYLDGMLYHHGSASFLASDDARVRSQVRARREHRYKRAVMSGRYQLTMPERVAFWLSDRERRTRRRASRALRRAVAALRSLLTG